MRSPFGVNQIHQVSRWRGYTEARLYAQAKYSSWPPPVKQITFDAQA